MAVPTSEEVYAKIQDALVDALAVEPEEVTPEATLNADLGAESIDYLDIVFRLEKGFDIKIPRGELIPESVLTDPNFVQDGKVTPAGIDELRRRMPFADIDTFAKNPLITEFQNLVTVGMVCKYVESKLRAKEEAMN